MVTDTDTFLSFFLTFHATSGAALVCGTTRSGPCSCRRRRSVGTTHCTSSLAEEGMFASMSITSTDLISVCFLFLFLSLSCVHSRLVLFAQVLVFAEPLSTMPSVKLVRSFSFSLSISYRPPFSILDNRSILGAACVAEDK
jgi:hypothetical protein